MADKYKTLNAQGDDTLIEFTDASAGAASAGKGVALGANGLLSETLFPPKYAPDVRSMPASEAIAAGAFVNIYNVSGTATIRNADANSSAKRAHGYVTAAIASGASGEVMFDDNNASVTGQTPGDVFLSTTTPGATQPAAPSGAGKIVQKLGVATSATTIHVNIQPITILS